MSEVYLGNPQLKRTNVPIQFTQEQIDEYIKCSESPEYFAEHYIKIVNVDRGLVPFDMYDYQRDMIRKFDKNRFVITKMPRQSGKSTTVTAFILWRILFYDNQNVAILANKGRLAMDLLEKIKLAYENLPKWLQQGVVTWNKGNIEIENGSKVVSAATSSSAIRGGSYNCVDGNSVTTVKINGNVFDISMKDLYDLIANSSKYICNNNYEANEYVFREQVHKVVPTINTNQLLSSGLCERETPHNTKKFGWPKQPRKSNILTNQTPHLGTQIVDKNDNWNQQEEDVLCLFYDDTHTNFRKTQHKTVSFGERTPEKLSVGPPIIERNEKKDFQSKYGETEKYTVVRNTSKEYIQKSYWRNKIRSSHEQNKQKSRENTKDRGISSRNEKNRGVKGEDAKSKNWLYSMEQRKTWNIFRRNFTENERCEIESIEVLTERGFKNFHGIKRTNDKKTIKVSTDNNTIICTPEHKIFTIDGYIEAQYCIDRHILNQNGKFELVNNLSENENIDVYDLLEVSDTHSYYCNNILVHQCIFLDEFAFVPRNIAENFFASVYPTISSGQSTQIIIVSTPSGMNHYYKMWIDAIENRSSYVPVEVHWRQIPGRDDAWRDETIRNTSEDQFRQEFECEFIGSSNTLISPIKLRELAFTTPNKDKWGLDIYEEPQINHSYLIPVDTAHGVGQDYSVFPIIDISVMPYKMVAKYRDNTISPMLFPEMIDRYGRWYNNAYVLPETNDIGQMVAEALHQDLEYENIITSIMKGRAGQRANFGFASRSNFGVRMTKQVKRIGCSNFKDLIEGDKLIINDFETIEEMSTFVARLQSYEAEDGYHDDLVMCLVMFSWFIRQPAFKQLTSMDVRNKLSEERYGDMMDDLMPAGFIDDGVEEPESIDNIRTDTGFWNNKF